MTDIRHFMDQLNEASKPKKRGRPSKPVYTPEEEELIQSVAGYYPSAVSEKTKNLETTHLISAVQTSAQSRGWGDDDQWTSDSIDNSDHKSMDDILMDYLEAIGRTDINMFQYRKLKRIPTKTGHASAYDFYSQSEWEYEAMPVAEIHKMLAKFDAQKAE